MYRMLAIFISCLLLSNQLCAFNGIYVGGAVGGNIFTGRQHGNEDIRSTDFLTDYTIDPSTDLFSTGFSGMIYAGLGYHWNCFYAGIEGFGQYSKNRIHQNFENNNLFAVTPPSVQNLVDATDAKISPWQWGIDARPGFLLDPTTLAYFRVGVAFSKFSLKSKSELTDTLTALPFDLTASDRVHKRKSALRLGCGIEKQICDRLSLRADYIYTHYGKLSLREEAVDVNAGAIFELTADKQVELRSHCLMLGLSYYFCKNSCSKNLPVCCSPEFCGFYIGGGLGGALTDSKVDLDLLSVAPGPGGPLAVTTHPNAFHIHQNRKNFRGDIFVGYGLQYGFKCFKLFTALEPFIQYSPYSRSFPVSFSSAFPGSIGMIVIADSTKMARTKIEPWQGGVDARLGFFPAPQLLLYGTIGTSAARVRASSDTQLSIDIEVGGVPTALRTLTVPVSASSTRATLRAGAGLEYALWGRCHLRADYRYTDYRKLHMHGSTSLSSPFGLLSLDVNSTVHPVDHAITVGLNWYLF